MKTGSDVTLYLTEEAKKTAYAVSVSAREATEDSRRPSISNGFEVMAARARMTMKIK